MTRDIFGRELKPRQFVVYGIRSGNSGGMRYGIILEPETQYNDAWGTGEKRVLVVTYNRYNKREFSTSRPSPENMIIVQDGTFPKDIEDKLDYQFRAMKEMA